MKDLRDLNDFEGTRCKTCKRQIRRCLDVNYCPSCAGGNCQCTRLKPQGAPCGYLRTFQSQEPLETAREFCIDNLLVRIHFIIVMIRWTGLALWGFEVPSLGSLALIFQVGLHLPPSRLDVNYCPSCAGGNCQCTPLKPQGAPCGYP